MDLTPKQQTSEAIRQAETILIMTAQRPSVDQVAAVIGLAQILRKFGKKVAAVISDSMPQSVQLLDTTAVTRNMGGMRDFVLKLDVTKSEVDKLRYEVKDGKLHIFITPYKGGFAPSDVTFDYGDAHYNYDLAIVLGVPTRVRIDRIYEQNLQSFENTPVINLDFHRSNENYGAVNLIEPNASSLCEMLVALAESLQGGIIDAEIATTLLMGIVASTDRFTAAHTTSKSLTVAAQMMAAGAKQQAVVKALYRGGATSERSERAERGERPQGKPREQREQRPAQQSYAPTSRPERQPEAPVRQPEPAPRQMEASRQPEPAREPAREADLPIIQPGHIEMSEQDDQPAAAAPTAPMPAFASGATPVPFAPEPAMVSDPEPALDPASQPATPPHTPAQQPSVQQAPQVPPMADFAAAAEILAQQQGSDSEDQPA